MFGQGWQNSCRGRGAERQRTTSAQHQHTTGGASAAEPASWTKLPSGDRGVQGGGNGVKGAQTSLPYRPQGRLSGQS